MCVSSSPLISVITVCRNAAVDLCNTAASVLAQNYAPIEYIIIDGASTDDTAQQIENNVLNVGLHYTHFLSRIKAFTMR